MLGYVQIKETVILSLIWSFVDVGTDSHSRLGTNYILDVCVLYRNTQSLDNVYIIL